MTRSGSLCTVRGVTPPRPCQNYIGTKNRFTVMSVADGELGINVDSDLDADEWDEWRDANGIFRANAHSPRDDF